MRKLGDFILGDDIEYSLTSTVEATSASITVKDGAGTTQLIDQALSKDSTLIWSGVLQTTDSWTKGVCNYKAKIVTGTYDNYEEGYFILNNDSGI